MYFIIGLDLDMHTFISTETKYELMAVRLQGKATQYTLCFSTPVLDQ